MVRFKVKRFAMIKSMLSISIPLWCDLKEPGAFRTKLQVRYFHPTMVRFKARAYAPCTPLISNFHPTMVRFKAVCRRLVCPPGRDFHPTMVRFKDSLQNTAEKIRQNFHPTMVRFKVVWGRQVLTIDNRISIPLWCDLKDVLYIPYPGTFTDFHPTMVRFKEGRQHWTYEVFANFHPTMVRFKVVLGVEPAKGFHQISIPLWCDLKLRHLIILPTNITPFPSHYGAI